MSDFKQYTIDEAPDSSRAVLQQTQKALGFVPNLYATFAESPQVLQGYVALEASLGRGELSAAERQIVEIAVSTENGCAYCVAAHSTLAGMVKADPGIVSDVRGGGIVRDAKIDALVRFTRVVIRNKGFVEEPEVAAFLAAGYTRAQVLEVVGHIGLKTIANYVNALTHVPLDAQLEAQKWDARQLQAA